MSFCILYVQNYIIFRLKKKPLSEIVSKGFEQAPHKENIQIINKHGNVLNLINN